MKNKEQEGLRSEYENISKNIATLQEQAERPHDLEHVRIDHAPVWGVRLSKSTFVLLSQFANLLLQGGSEYRVPDFLEEASVHGYISPDLPNPRGFKWKRFPGGCFALALQGG